MSTEDTRVSHFEPGTREGACLVVMRAPDLLLLGRRIELGDAELAIGRGAENGLVLEDPEASRRHARIVADAGGHRVVDAGSRNGTWVNEAQVEGRTLANGDHVRIGSTILKYFAGGDPEPRYHDELRGLAMQDALTGASNRRHLLDVLDREVARCPRHGRALSVLLLDIDHFKQVNDTFGHAAGDEVLRRLAGVIAPMVRREDCFARHGGEEFALVLPETPVESARLLAEKIRRRVEEERFEVGGRRVELTVSVGVAALAGAEAPAELLGAADAHLYEAKRAGRNRVAG